MTALPKVRAPSLAQRRALLAAGAMAMLPAWAQRVGPVATPFAWPAITLLDGQVLPPAAWQDTAAVLVFWATHCPFCRRHNVHVEKLHRAVAGKPLRVLTLSSDRDPKLVQRYMQSNGYTFPVSLLDTEALRLSLALLRTLPTTVGISRRGRVGLALPGEMFEEDVLEMARLADAV
jgi:thiol-disulfide isomerase/thioredoxin